MSREPQPVHERPTDAIHRRRRWLATGGVLAAAALVIVGVVVAVEAHEKSGTRAVPGPCGDLQVALEAPTTRTAVPVQAGQRFALDVHVGDTIAIASSGHCARTVSGSPQNASVLRGVDGTHFTAARPGESNLELTMPMCAGSGPACRGGFFEFARVTVVVSTP
jgi:hypothetical protein